MELQHSFIVTQTHSNVIRLSFHGTTHRGTEESESYYNTTLFISKLPRTDQTKG